MARRYTNFVSLLSELAGNNTGTYKPSDTLGSHHALVALQGEKLVVTGISSQDETLETVVLAEGDTLGYDCGSVWRVPQPTEYRNPIRRALAENQVSQRRLEFVDEIVVDELSYGWVESLGSQVAIWGADGRAYRVDVRRGADQAQVARFVRGILSGDADKNSRTAIQELQAAGYTSEEVSVAYGVYPDSYCWPYQPKGTNTAFGLARAAWDAGDDDLSTFAQETIARIETKRAWQARLAEIKLGIVALVEARDSRIDRHVSQVFVEGAGSGIFVQGMDHNCYTSERVADKYNQWHLQEYYSYDAIEGGRVTSIRAVADQKSGWEALASYLGI